MKKLLIFLISFAIIALLDISTTFAQVQNQQQRADNGKPYTVAIHRLNNKALNDSLLMETEDTTNFFSRRTSVGDLKNYIANNLPDTAFKNIDTIPKLLQTDYFLVSNDSGQTRRVNNVVVTTQRKLTVSYTMSADSVLTVDEFSTLYDDDGDLIVYSSNSRIGKNFQLFFVKNATTDPPNFENTFLNVNSYFVETGQLPIITTSTGSFDAGGDSFVIYFQQSAAIPEGSGKTFIDIYNR